MSDDTIYPSSMYPGGSEEEFAALKKDAARLDFIERTRTYPWPDFGGVWKFRGFDGRMYVADRLREVLDQAIEAEEQAQKAAMGDPNI